MRLQVAQAICVTFRVNVIENDIWPDSLDLSPSVLGSFLRQAKLRCGPALHMIWAFYDVDSKIKLVE
jgi:hypothetical protein